MKRSERHHLKENEFVALVDRTSDVVTTRGREITALLALVVVLALAIGGYFLWKGRTEGQASAMLANANAVLEAEVVPPAPAQPGQKAPTPPAGTFTSEQAKLSAALPKLTEVYTRYPSTQSGVAAKYEAANALAVLGRRSEAEALYQQLTGRSGIYGTMSKMGLANVLAEAGQSDRAISLYKELSSDTTGGVPTDGVLIQLARTYAKAGRRADAQQTYNRLVQEFPESLYVPDAKREMEALKKS
jgi:tetratricopeptide (TPR) repeat protein